MNPNTDNYFNLTNPNEYACHVWSYSVSLGLLSVKIMNRFQQKDVQWLTFLSVDYFEGPMHWFGANFHIGSSEEILALCYRIGKSKNTTEERLLKNNTLFKVRFEVENIEDDTFNWGKILAIKANIQQDDETA